MNNFEKGYNFLEVNNIQIHYSLEGDPKNPTLVLINMASHNLTSWEVVIGDFLQDFQVLRFDGRGTGLSGYDEDKAFNFFVFQIFHQLILLFLEKKAKKYPQFRNFLYCILYQ